MSDLGYFPATESVLRRYTCGFCPGAWWVGSVTTEREPMWCPWCGRAGVLPEAPAPATIIAYEARRHEYLSRRERWCAAHPPATDTEREAACAWIGRELGL